LSCSGVGKVVGTNVGIENGIGKIIFVGSAVVSIVFTAMVGSNVKDFVGENVLTTNGTDRNGTVVPAGIELG
jgi:hypothetical protein